MSLWQKAVLNICWQAKGLSGRPLGTVATLLSGKRCHPEVFRLGMVRERVALVLQGEMTKASSGLRRAIQVPGQFSFPLQEPNHEGRRLPVVVYGPSDKQSISLHYARLGGAGRGGEAFFNALITLRFLVLGRLHELRSPIGMRFEESLGECEFVIIFGGGGRVKCHCHNDVNLRGKKGAVCSLCGCEFIGSPEDEKTAVLIKKGGGCWVTLPQPTRK